MSALHTNSVDFGYFIGNGAKSRHRAEGKTAEVHIQTCYNNTYAIIGKLITYINQAIIKELRFVDTYYIDF